MQFSWCWDLFRGKFKLVYFSGRNHFQLYVETSKSHRIESLPCSQHFLVDIDRLSCPPPPPPPFQQPGERKCLRGLYVVTRKIGKGLERSFSCLSCRFSAHPHKQTTCLKQANVKRENVKHNSLLDSFSRSGPCLDGEQEYEPSGTSLRSDTSCDSGWNFLPAIFLLLRLLLLWKNKQLNVGIFSRP